MDLTLTIIFLGNIRACNGKGTNSESPKNWNKPICENSFMAHFNSMGFIQIKTE